MRNKILDQSGKEYWRSVEEFVDAPEFEEFVKDEYPAHAEEWADGLSRRNFIKVMGASLAFAGLSGCVIQPAEKIVPYVRQPEEIIPGKPLFYSTAMTLGGVGVGLLAKSNEGRPTKIEGNPEHPGSLGATDVFAQASILQMYDPDRSQQILYRGNPSTWQNFMTQTRGAIDQNRADGGAGIRFLAETVTSPTLIAQFNQIFAELPNARLYQYEPLNKDNQTAGAKMAFGTPARAVYRFDQAARILSLDDDFLSSFNVRYVKDFVKARTISEEKRDMNRLYMVETTHSITGAKADHRIAVKPSQVPEIAKAIAAAVGVSGANSTYTENPAWISALANDLLANRGRSIVIAGANQPPVVHALVNAMNQTLGNVGTTVTYIEPFQPNADLLQIDALRQLVQEIDGGAVKMLVILDANPVYNTPFDLRLNAERMNKIPLRIHTGLYVDETAELCHWHVNAKHFLEMWSDTRAYDGTVSIVQPLIEPLYEGKSMHEVAQVFARENYDKKDYDIVREFWQKQGLASASRTIAATANTGENASGNTSVVPGSMGARGTDAASAAAGMNQTSPATTGASSQTATANQPGSAVTQTGSTTQSPNSGQLTAGAGTGATTNSASGASQSFDDNWKKVVHDGFVPNSAAATKAVSVNTTFLTQTPPPVNNNGALEISILPDPTVYDGRFSNNGWLQELPKPLNKTTWDNVALISPNTARNLGLNQDKDYNPMAGGEEGTSFVNTKGGNLFSDVVTLSCNGAEIQAGVPVWIQPGQPDDVVTIFAGYGRAKAGQIGTGIGYNAYDVSSAGSPWMGTGALNKRGEQTQISSTQTHFNMEGRDILRVFDLEKFEQNPEMGHQHNEYDKTMYGSSQPGGEFQKHYNENHRWAMAIDLNNCVGCNACVVACQSENNIPVVGKEQVGRSREMHWMRIDTYYTGDDLNSPDTTSFQPLLCQQCEQAPCEPVCPVHATVHSAEGLNDMVYNRCVGTRYCSNNCPYKVRRFNFLLYQDWDTPQYKLMRNPEVTVRSRGVMEKCTYCTQRIASARIEARKDNRMVRDGEVQTACQTVCPADAIVFGDLNDKGSQVFKLKQDHRNYNLLNDLNTQPRTTYLAAIKNQNREMPDYKNDLTKIRSLAKQKNTNAGEPNEGAAH
ncbi:MAG TPA: TAT-variant-translocated molybdopterin oxidoreductase [Pyrinomonadaceae bacterium]|nr:TAT-variant-translocated molybdopterin oxidoreductase [Pyrinomonadaceae bacterium]